MALTVGQLVATFDVDPRPAVAGITRAEAMMHGLGTDAEVTGRQIRAGLDEALHELPQVRIDADATPAEREIDAIRQRLTVLRDTHVGVNVDTDQAGRDIAAVRARLTELAAESTDVRVQAQVADAITALNTTARLASGLDAMAPTVDVHADTAAATRSLAQVAVAAAAIDHSDPHIDVHVDDQQVGRLARSLSGLWGMLVRLGSDGVGALSSLASAAAAVGAAVPLVAGLSGALANILPAAAVAVTGVYALVGAIGAVKLGTSGIGGALRAALAPATGGGAAGAAAAGTNAVADAQRNLQRATENAAYSNKQAVQQVASAERDLVAAQRSALAAQAAINDARHQAVRDLEDLNNSLTDAQFAEQDAANAVTDAAGALSTAQATGDPQQIARAQLAYDEAVQALVERRLQTKRLAADTAAANQAGIEGSRGVTDAKQREADAVQTVRDRTLALSNAQEQQARTAHQGADAIRQAQEALAQAGAAGASGGGGGVDAFAEAMAKLAPAARAFVREVISLRPAWDRLQLSVQQHLFEGLAGALGSTATAVLPVLRRSLDLSATALNGMAKGVLNAARNLARDGVLGQAMDGAARGLQNLSGVPGLVVTAFTQIAAAGAPQFDKLTKSMASGAQSLADKISKSFKSGGMAEAIDLAVSLIKQIGGVLKNVGSIIGSVFGAANSAGGSWLGVLKDITGAMAKAFASPAVQAALGALFGTMKILGQTLAPLVAQALGEIAPVLTALAPAAQTLVSVLGDALRPIIKALGPILVQAADAVGALVLALVPLLPVVGDLIAQLLPVLSPVLKGLTTIFLKLAGPIASIADALGRSLTPIMSALGDVVDDVVSAYLPAFVSIIDQMIPLIPVLTPVLIQLGDSIAEILEAVGPLLPQFTMLTLELVTQLLPAILPLIPLLADFATVWLILATDVITKVVIPTLKGIIKFLDGLRAAFQPAIDAVTWLTTTISGLFEWLYDHLVGHSVIPDLVREIVRWFAGLPGKAAAALASLPGAIGAKAVAAGNSLISGVRTGINAAVSWLRDLPGRAKDALGDIGGYLYRSGQALMSGFADGVRSMASTVGDAAASVLGYAKGFFPNSPAKRGPFSGPGWTRHSGVATGGDFADGLMSQHAAVGQAARALMASAQGPLLGGLPGQPAGVGMGTGGALHAGPSGSAGGGQVTLRIELAGPDEMKRMIRGIVRSGGGTVQTVLGGV